MLGCCCTHARDKISKSAILGVRLREPSFLYIPLEASFYCASDGAIDKPPGIEYGPKLAQLHFYQKRRKGPIYDKQRKGVFFTLLGDGSRAGRQKRF